MSVNRTLKRKRERSRKGQFLIVLRIFFSFLDRHAVNDVFSSFLAISMHYNIEKVSFPLSLHLCANMLEDFLIIIDQCSY